MKKWGHIIFLLFLFNSLSTISQQQNFAFKNIDINTGLSQNSVVDVAEDTTGFIWMATQDGLNRYDGRNFLIFPKSFDDITTPNNVRLGKLVADGSRLWLIKKGGKIETMDLYTQEFTPVVHLGDQKAPIPPASSIFIDSSEGLWIGLIDQGLLYFNRANELIEFSNKSVSGNKLISNNIRSVFEDRRKVMWVLTDSGITKISEGEIIEDHLEAVNTNVMTEAPDGSLWVGTLGEGIYVKEPGSESFEKFSGFDSPFPKNLVVEAVHADDHSRIWVGTYGNGLFIVDTAKNEITHLIPDRHNPYSLNFQDVLSIEEDSKGGLWIGTDGGGVSYYNPQFNNFNTIATHNVEEHISIEQIRSIVTDDEGVVWMGTSGQGLTSYDPNKKKFNTIHLSPYKPGISNYDRIVALEIDGDGDLWIGTQGNGLLILDRSTGEIKKWFTSDALEEEWIPDNTIWSFIPEADHMWIATRNEGLVLVKKDKGFIEKFILPADGQYGTEGRNVQAVIRITDSTLALGFQSRGVYLLNSNTGKFSAVAGPSVGNISFAETDIKSLYYQDNWIWIGTGGKGVVVTNLTSEKNVFLNDTNWLPNNMVYAILPEDSKALWMSSNKGLFRLLCSYGQDSLSIRRVSAFTVGDGLQSNEFNTGAHHKARDGILLFGGISGLTYFDPDNLSYNNDNLNIVLTQAMVGNNPLESDTTITYLQHIKLPHWQNSLSFSYTVLDFISPENLNYQYRLEGYDDNWVDAGKRNYTAYTNLPPADYVFKVKVSDKISSRAPSTSLFISIAVPFWRQWWFILLVIFMALAFIYGLHRYRIYQVVQVQKVKNNISADLHDDLGSRLTNIQFLTALSKKKVATGTRESKYLQGIEEEVEASAKALDEIVWNIKMKDESLEEILAKMRKYAGEVLENNYEYEFNITGNFKRKKMSMQKRRELFLVFKELLNNIKKHAAATTVNIEIAIKEDMFFLRVKDNGKGFDPNTETSRNGLRNIKERVKRWNGVIKINSNEKTGTSVAIRLPFDRWLLKI